MSEETKKPTNLSECFEQLDKILSEAEDEDWFKSATEKEAIAHSHHGLGTMIRNDWGLWVEDSDLHQYLKNLGLKHADDMSSVILTSYHRKINGKELELDEQVKYYIEFWKKQEK